MSASVLLSIYDTCMLCLLLTPPPLVRLRMFGQGTIPLSYRNSAVAITNWLIWSFPHSWLWDHRVCCIGNTTDATSGAGTAYPSRALEFTPGFGGDLAVQSLVFSVVLCTSLFVFCSFSLAILLSVLLRVTDFDYFFGIFNLFLIHEDLVSSDLMADMIPIWDRCH